MNPTPERSTTYPRIPVGLATESTCGTCTQCCKTMAVKELDKPRDTWCTHCKIGSGCTIYADRPGTCAGFSCLWLRTQSSPQGIAPLPPEMRPDKSRVVLDVTTDGKNLVMQVDPARPNAFRKGKMGVFFDIMRKRGPVFVLCGEKRVAIASTRPGSDQLATIDETMHKHLSETIAALNPPQQKAEPKP